MRLPVLMTTLLLGCQPSAVNGDSGSLEGSTAICDCCLGVQVTPFPRVTATDVPVQTAIEFRMSEVELDAELAVPGVSGSQQVIGDRIVFTPDEPLAPSTTYTATLNWSCGPTTSNFTTSDTGPAVVPGSLEESLLINAIEFENDELQMPPDEPLSDEEVASLRKWVKLGAPHPDAKE